LQQTEGGEQKGDSKGVVVELGGRKSPTTNNQMELTAALEGLKRLDQLDTEHGPIFVYTDSRYLINGITKWVFGWQKNNWITSQKEPVVNQELWEGLLEVTHGKRIEWKYVGGHSGIAGNERCDVIATEFADGA